ncbi:MAG: prolipoprotein diacylglyceryl transferase [Coriobacteriia bacterium]|nr:prolipoprotein diacylglyceryl transferase [Coriobacteriia bacterium]
MPFPDIDPVAVRIGPLSLHWYGLAYVAAFAIAGLLFRHLVRRWNVGLSDDDVMEVVVFSIAGVLIGARLGYVVVYGGGQYWRDPLSVLEVWDGGMSFHGGLVGIVAAGLLVARRLKVPFLRMADAAAVGAPVGFFLGRIANFVNAELWGRPTDLPWAVVFPGAGPRPRHPSQLYEALLEGAVIFVVLWSLSRRERPRGTLLGWLLVMYGAFRFAVEFVREPDPHLGLVLGPFTTGQILSVPMLLAGVALLVWVRRGSSQGPSSTAHGGRGT